MNNYVVIKTDIYSLEVKIEDNFLDNSNIIKSINVANVNAPLFLEELLKQQITPQDIFRECRSIEISRGIEELRDNCLGICERLKIVYLPDTLTRIDESILEGNNTTFREIHIPCEVLEANYSKLKKIFGENFKSKVVLKNICLRDERIQKNFKEFKKYETSWDSLSKYNLYKNITNRVRANSLKRIITNDNVFKKLDSKFSAIINYEKEIVSKNLLDETNKEYINLLIKASDDPSSLTESERAATKDFFEKR